MLTQTNRYFIVDVETDGPVPGTCSLLNLAVIVTDEAINEIDSFSVNLHPVPGLLGDPETLNWWKSQPNAWTKITENACPAEIAMKQFEKFVQTHNGRRIFVGHPLIFDGLWVSHYMQAYLGQGLMASHAVTEPLFFGAGIDLPSFVSGALSIDYRLCRHGMYPPEIAAETAHTHVGLDDARGHAEVFRKTVRLTKRTVK